MVLKNIFGFRLKKNVLINYKGTSIFLVRFTLEKKIIPVLKSVLNCFFFLMIFRRNIFLVLKSIPMSEYDYNNFQKYYFLLCSIIILRRFFIILILKSV
jgi:hypothetical protein